jgi:hypothetical protein
MTVFSPRRTHPAFEYDIQCWAIWKHRVGDIGRAAGMGTEVQNRESDLDSIDTLLLCRTKGNQPMAPVARSAAMSSVSSPKR